MLSIWNTETLVQFNQLLYGGLLRKEHIASNEIVKKYKDTNVYGYILEVENPKTKLKDRYFVRTQDIEKLPLQINREVKFHFRSEVFRMVESSVSCSIPSRNEIPFRALVDFYANYSHSNEKHWKLARIISLIPERINVRIVSEASFGKDALVDIKQLLIGGVSNLYNATLAKLKFALNNDCVIINEMGGLKKEEVGQLQAFFTQSLAYKPTYENNSRAHSGVKEVMSLIGKSFIIYHNTPDYYESKGQLYFEQMFTKAVTDRAPALLFKGYVTEDFSKAKSIDSFPKMEQEKLKSFISTMNYLKENPPRQTKFTIDDSFWEFRGRENQRALRSFKIISKYLAEYADTESEFIEWCEILKKCRMDYQEMIGNVKIEEEHVK